jgi:glycosyltransferase involved in cell wall biosynthesis
MSERLPITVCTLCLNEAKNLPRCLSQIEAFEEWLVLDTGSCDDSMRIARDLGARVEATPWKGFSVTRDEHFKLATQPWILWLDADEELTSAFIEELGDLLPKIAQNAAYQINRLMFFEGKWIRHGDWFPDRVTRLFRADAWSMPHREIHESVEISGPLGELIETVPHYSYRDWGDREKRVESYTSLWASQQHQRGKTTPLVGPPLRGIWKLVRGLILKKGFLDGAIGWKVAWSNAQEVSLKYRKLRKLNDQTSPDSH